jgi:hypothetical protein
MLKRERELLFTIDREVLKLVILAERGWLGLLLLLGRRGSGLGGLFGGLCGHGIAFSVLVVCMLFLLMMFRLVFDFAESAE